MIMPSGGGAETQLRATARTLSNMEYQCKEIGCQSGQNGDTRHEYADFNAILRTYWALEKENFCSLFKKSCILWDILSENSLEIFSCWEKEISKPSKFKLGSKIGPQSPWMNLFSFLRRGLEGNERSMRKISIKSITQQMCSQLLSKELTCTLIYLVKCQANRAGLVRLVILIFLLRFLHTPSLQRKSGHKTKKQTNKENLSR